MTGGDRSNLMWVFWALDQKGMPNSFFVPKLHHDLLPSISRLMSLHKFSISPEVKSILGSADCH